MTPSLNTTWLWQSAFGNACGPDTSARERADFEIHLKAMREKVRGLVARIAHDMPGYTVHDETHLDALWETTSLVANPDLPLNPPEGFVFGGAVLLHDAAMTLAAYPGGLAELKATTAWADTAALWGGAHSGSTAPPLHSVETETHIQVEVLRRLHAEKAEELATQGWAVDRDTQERVYLIDDIDLRRFYGKTIGLLAHSHWWPISRVERDLTRTLGAMPPRTRHEVDLVKLATLLRVADALQLDRRRAPHFRRALERPNGISALHWTSQEKLAFPYISNDAVIFTAGEPFEIKDAEAWWLAYDAFTMADRELHDADILLRSRGKSGLAARRIQGVGNPQEMAKYIPVSGWRPVETRPRASDIAKITTTLRGEKLYGDEPTVPVRELLQNAMDAIQARRRLQDRSTEWGKITVSLTESADGVWLSVEDTGVGMSEAVLTGPLLDFGSCLWRSSQIAHEFPGLAAKGMNSLGRFEIGFFSVFMLGDHVRVTTRRYDYAEREALTLEFRTGVGSRAILSSAQLGTAPMDGGTRVEIKLRIDPRCSDGIRLMLREEKQYLYFPPRAYSLAGLVTKLAPASSVSIDTVDLGRRKQAILANDWQTISSSQLAARVTGVQKEKDQSVVETFMRDIIGLEGTIFGRAAISPHRFGTPTGVLTVGGLCVDGISHILGIVFGDVTTAARDTGSIQVPPEALSTWAADQAKLIEASGISTEGKMLCAEICLECRASIFGLPIARRGNVWLNSYQLRADLAHMSEISLFADDIRYEEYDNVPQWIFDKYFEFGEDVLFIPTVSQRLGAPQGRGWDKYGPRPSYLKRHVLSIVREVWGDYQERTTDEQVIGRAEGEDITRIVDVYCRPSTDRQEC